MVTTRFGLAGGWAMAVILGAAGAVAGEPAPAAAPPAASGQAVAKGDVVFRTGFEAEAERTAWSKAPWAEWVSGYQGSTSLRVTVPADQAAGGHMIQLPIDLRRYAGCRLRFECQAKSENASKPPQVYLGVKYMLHYVSAAGGPRWQNQDSVFGTFDWKSLGFVASIEPDVTEAEISLGLQESSGTVWFDDLRVTVVAPPRPPRPAPPANPPPAYKGHNLPRLRGAMSANVFREEDLRVFGQEWNANLIRWQICRNWGKPGTDRDLAEYDRWLDGRLTELDQALDACRRYGILAVIDLHSPPGGRYEDNSMGMLRDAVYQDHFVAVWERIARRYKGVAGIWGYDLVNEPVQGDVPAPAGVEDYLGAQVRAARAIRAIDPDRPIFIESNQWDSAAAFRELDPVDVPNVVYQVHMYVPHEFTHQGVYGSATGVVYPGTIGGKAWDREALRQVLAPVREFQLACNVHIYVGEFSAIRWAPGDSASRYLRDCIELFEEYGWDWSYHAFREWDGWSVEHGPDPNDHQRAATPTDRQKLLLEWFAKNRKP